MRQLNSMHYMHLTTRVVASHGVGIPDPRLSTRPDLDSIDLQQPTDHLLYHILSSSPMM